MEIELNDEQTILTITKSRTGPIVTVCVLSVVLFLYYFAVIKGSYDYVFYLVPLPWIYFLVRKIQAVRFGEKLVFDSHQKVLWKNGKVLAEFDEIDCLKLEDTPISKYSSSIFLNVSLINRPSVEIGKADESEGIEWLYHLACLIANLSGKKIQT